MVKKEKGMKTQKRMKKEEEIRGIVRIAGRDVEGGLPLKRALSRIKGVGLRMADVVARVAVERMKLSPDVVAGELTDEQLGNIEAILNNPVKFGIPSWMLNRQMDLETGLDKHLIGNELTFAVKQDIEKEKRIGTWRGYRHAYGQKVRGQRTRTTGRKGMTVGVIRKAKKKGGAARKEEKKKR